MKRTILASAMLTVLATPLAAQAHDRGGQGGLRDAVSLSTQSGTQQSYGESNPYIINKPPSALSADAPTTPAPSSGSSDFIEPDRSDDRN
jgi:hypothetical protein